MYHDFLGPRELQGTHMDTSKPKKLKSITFTVRGSFFTFWVILAQNVPWHPRILADQLTLSQRGERIKPTTLLLGTPRISSPLTDLCVCFQLKKIPIIILSGLHNLQIITYFIFDRLEFLFDFELF